MNNRNSPGLCYIEFPSKETALQFFSDVRLKVLRVEGQLLEFPIVGSVSQIGVAAVASEEGGGPTSEGRGSNGAPPPGMPPPQGVVAKAGGVGGLAKAPGGPSAGGPVGPGGPGEEVESNTILIKGLGTETRETTIKKWMYEILPIAVKGVRIPISGRGKGAKAGERGQGGGMVFVTYATVLDARRVLAALKLENNVIHGHKVGIFGEGEIVYWWIFEGMNFVLDDSQTSGEDQRRNQHIKK